MTFVLTRLLVWEVIRVGKLVRTSTDGIGVSSGRNQELRPSMSDILHESGKISDVGRSNEVTALLRTPDSLRVSSRRSVGL